MPRSSTDGLFDGIRSFLWPNDKNWKPTNLEMYDDYIAQTDNNQRYWIMKSRNRIFIDKVTKANAVMFKLRRSLKAALYSIVCGSVGFYGLGIAIYIIKGREQINLFLTIVISLVAIFLMNFLVNSGYWFFLSVKNIITPSVEIRFIWAMERIEKLTVQSPTQERTSGPSVHSRPIEDTAKMPRKTNAKALRIKIIFGVLAAVLMVIIFILYEINSNNKILSFARVRKEAQALYIRKKPEKDEENIICSLYPGAIVQISDGKVITDVANNIRFVHVRFNWQGHGVTTGWVGRGQLEDIPSADQKGDTPQACEDGKEL